MRDNMIIHKSEYLKHDDFLKWASVEIVDCKPTDNLILEDWHIKIYEHSKQWNEDSNKYHLTKENKILKNENEKLERIAKVWVETKSKRYWKWEKLTDFEKNIYMLNHLKEC